MRGEHFSGVSVSIFTKGSSPHARGTLGDEKQYFDGRGIIPACAGNTRCFPVLSRARWDHPRMRGEHAMFLNPSAMVSGSSPHARGTQRRVPEHQCRYGIIPACAGNTNLDVNFDVIGGDHPRMRGEHHGLIERDVENAGSSPHARGTHRTARVGRMLQGIIPACAGNTSSRGIF